MVEHLSGVASQSRATMGWVVVSFISSSLRRLVRHVFIEAPGIPPRSMYHERRCIVFFVRSPESQHINRISGEAPGIPFLRGTPFLRGSGIVSNTVTVGCNCATAILQSSFVHARTSVVPVR